MWTHSTKNTKRNTGHLVRTVVLVFDCFSARIVEAFDDRFATREAVLSGCYSFRSRLAHTRNVLGSTDKRGTILGDKGTSVDALEAPRFVQ